MKEFRSHPINILEMTSRYLILLLLPILRTLWAAFQTFQAGEIFSWLESVWLTLLVIAIILALGWYRWYSFTFWYDHKGIHACRGVILKQHWFLSYQRITSVALTYPWYFIPLHAVRLQADTDGGSTKRADFTITVSKQTAEEIAYISKIPFADNRAVKNYYIPNNWAIALFSFLSSNSVAGAIYMVALGSNLSKIFGNELTDRLMSQVGVLTGYIKFVPPIVTVVFIIIAATWGVSFLSNMQSNLRFCVSRRSNALEIEAGLFTRRKISIQATRINALMLKQSLLTVLFNLYSASILCTGYGQRKGDSSPLIPTDSKRNIDRNLKVLLPEFTFTPPTLRPKKKTFSRFIFVPSMIVLSWVLLFLVGAYFLPSFEQTIFVLCLFAEFPTVWWFICKWYSFSHTGIGFGENSLSFYKTFGFRIIQGSIPYDKITKVVCSQDVFQHSSHCCNVYIYLYGESSYRINVQNLDLQEVKEHLPFL